MGWGKRARKTTNSELAEGQNQKRSFNFSSAWGKRAATGSSEQEMESANGQNKKRSFNFSSSWGKRDGSKTTNSESKSIDGSPLTDQLYLELLIVKKNDLSLEQQLYLEFLGETMKEELESFNSLTVM